MRDHRASQQHLPSCVIQASVAPRASGPADARATDVRQFDGPVPTMLDEALRWVEGPFKLPDCASDAIRETSRPRQLLLCDALR